MEKLYKNYNILELATMALKRPDDFGWWGRNEMFISWGFCGIDMSNASDALEICNFQYITNDLINRYPDDFEIVGLKHWAVGHCDRLTCRVLYDANKGVEEDNITDAFHSAINWHIQLEDYPIADEDSLYEYCNNEMLEWITSEIPAEVYIKNSKEETAEQILQEIYSDGHSSALDDVLSQVYPTDLDIRHAAYDLSLCYAEYKDFWDEWVDENNLPPIHWGDNFGAPVNAVHKINGQLNLFEDE